MTPAVSPVILAFAPVYTKTCAKCQGINATNRMPEGSVVDWGYEAEAKPTPGTVNHTTVDGKGAVARLRRKR
jgi:hypothetical protein